MSLVDTFQDAVLHVPDLLQPVIVAAAGAVPFIEGEGAATIGVLETETEKSRSYIERVRQHDARNAQGTLDIGSRL